MKMEASELFIGYIEETLSVSERESFEDRLKNESGFGDDFHDFKETYNMMENQFSSERKQVIKTINRADVDFKSSQDSKASSGKLVQFKPWQYALAASVILAIGLFLFQGSNKPVYADYATHNAISLTQRGETQTSVKQAETAFNNGDYQEALDEFKTVLKTNPDRIDFQLYKGQALIETNNFTQADALLKQISEGNSVYSSQAIWWSALSKLKQKQYDEVKILLKKIDSNSAEYEKAQALLEKL